MHFDELLKLTLSNPNQKKTTDYGLKLTKKLWGEIDRSQNGYFGKRAKRCKMLRDFGSGEIDMKQFIDLMGIDGNKAYVNLDYTPPKIAHKFMEIIVGGFMQKEEMPRVSATDDESNNQKEIEKQLARYRMLFKEEIEELEQMGGIKLTDPTAFTPEDEDEITIFFDQEFRTPEEILFEKRLWAQAVANQYRMIKRKCLRDIAEVNEAVVRVTKNDDGSFTLSRHKPETVIYSYFETDTGQDLSYIGHLYPIKICEARAMYPSIDERKWWELAKKAKQNVVGEIAMWKNEWNTSNDRPYDEYSLLVWTFQIKSYEKELYAQETNRHGSPVIKPVTSARPSAQMHEDELENIYEGHWIVDSDVMLSWGLKENITRPYADHRKAAFDYCIVKPNNDGTLVPSLLDKGLQNIRGMIQVLLKLQHMIAKMRPAGMAVDIAGLREIDLGTGDSIEPLEIEKIYDQTGNIYYDSEGLDPENRKNIPIMELANAGSTAQLQALIQSYNFYLDRLREDIGVNEYRDGSSVPAKLGLGVQMNQITASNNATSYVYEYFNQLMIEVYSRMTMQMWDAVVLQAGQYKEFMGMELSMLDKTFKVSIDILPGDQEKQRIEEQINKAITANVLDFEDAFRLSNMNNLKLAELYIARTAKKKRMEAMQKETANQQFTIQAQQASNKQAVDGKIAETNAKSQGEMAVKQMEIEGVSKSDLQKFVLDIQMAAFETGKEIPAHLQGLVNMVLQGAMQGLQPPPTEEDHASASYDEAIAAEQEGQPEVAPE